MGTNSSVCEERAIKRPHCQKRFYADIFIGAAAAIGFSYFFLTNHKDLPLQGRLPMALP